MNDSQKARGARRRRSSKEEREAVVAAWEGSAQTQEEFARVHGLAVGTLRNWIRRQQKAAPSVTLREVGLGEALGAPRWVAEIRRSDGTVIRVAAEVSPAWIAQVWEALPC